MARSRIKRQAMLFPDRPITVEHIRAFCARFDEGYRVEYKSNFDTSVREKVPKVLSSLANSNGGVLVIGVSTVNGVPHAPFDGFQPSPREEFALTVENICLQNIYPPILLRTTVVASDVAGHMFVVIEVDESAQAPHAIENSKRVYVRTGNAANPYDLAEVDLILELVRRRKEPFERRARLLDRAKRRFNTYLDRKYADRGGRRTDLGTLLQFSVGPRFPARQLCRQEDLKALVQKWMKWRGTWFPNPGCAILSQHESAIVLNAAIGIPFYEINVWGMLFYGTLLGGEVDAAPAINLSAFLGYILFFPRHAATMLQALGWSGLVDVEMVLGPIRNIRWLNEGERYPVALSGSELDDELALMIPTSSEALRDKPDGVAMEIFRHVFFSVNLPDLVDAPQKLQRLVHYGYAYNGWPPTQNLLL
jgi:schlafen family protein